MLSVPPQSNHHDEDVDEPDVSHDGHEVEIQLLVRLQLLDIDAETVSRDLHNKKTATELRLTC